jgi:hypothetical protein
VFFDGTERGRLAPAKAKWADMTDKKDYEVGYCKPPKHSRFKKGESGHPSGPKRGNRSLKTILNEVMAEKISINGKAMPKKEAAVRRLFADAMTGNRTAMTSLLSLLSQTGELSVEQDLKPALSELDQSQFLRAVRRFHEEAEDKPQAEPVPPANEPVVETEPVSEEDEAWLR